MIELFVITLLAFLGVIVQTVVGFGFGSFVLPAVLLYFSAPRSIIITLLAANIVSLLTLFAEKRKREFSRQVTSRLFVTALPGLCLGAYVVSQTNKATLQILVGILIIGGMLIQEYFFPKPTKQLGITRGIYTSGFLSGLMSGSAGQAQPPLIIWLRSHVISVNQFRDNLAVMFLLINSSTILAIFVASRPTIDSKILIILSAMLLVIILGHRIGKVLVKKINSQHYRKLVFLYGSCIRPDKHYFWSAFLSSLAKLGFQITPATDCTASAPASRYSW